ncbi:MAG: hypothetical protein KDC98_07245 [Planctomycetes bacterium]|nr:hypothetical protein [Planctomycetota bacterium]
MRLRSFTAALVLPVLASTASAQLEAQLAGLTRTTSALRFYGANCTPLNNGCTTNLPATVPAWAGGTGYDAESGEFWVSEGHVLARVDPRGCGYSCGPYPAPGVNSVVTGIEVLERTGELLVLDSSGVLNVLSLGGSCNGPQLISSCGTGLTHQGQTVTSGIAADESRGLIFMSYTDFATGQNQIAVAHLPTGCTPFTMRPLAGCTTTAFGAVRGIAVDSCNHTLFATDGVRVIRVRYAFDPVTVSLTLGTVACCPLLSTNLDPFVGLALRPNPGEPSGQSCNNGSCRPCPMRHSLLTGPVLGNSNLLFHLDDAQPNTWTWLGLGFGHCRSSGPVIYPLCGPLLIGGATATSPPLIAGPYPVSGAGGACAGSATVVVDFPYVPAFCGSRWSSMFVSLCQGSVGTAPFGTAMSNCLSWTVIGP